MNEICKFVYVSLFNFFCFFIPVAPPQMEGRVSAPPIGHCGGDALIDKFAADIAINTAIWVQSQANSCMIALFVKHYLLKPPHYYLLIFPSNYITHNNGSMQKF